MTSRSEWAATVAERASHAGVARTERRASYPEPAEDVEAVAYLRHLGDVLAAVPVNRARAEHTAAVLQSAPSATRAESDSRLGFEDELKALEAEQGHLLEVIARHGYAPKARAKSDKPDE